MTCRLHVLSTSPHTPHDLKSDPVLCETDAQLGALADHVRVPDDRAFGQLEDEVDEAQRDGNSREHVEERDGQVFVVPTMLE